MNRGVGRSFQNCLGLAEGKYIFKIDADIIFRPKWLSKAIAVLDNNPDVGGVGLFDYHRQDPNDSRFKPENNILEKRPDCTIVNDFVTSIWGFRNRGYKELSGYFPIPDDGLHHCFEKKALLDVVDNEAWGVGKSVYVSGTMEKPIKTPTFNEPFLLSKP